MILTISKTQGQTMGSFRSGVVARHPMADRAIHFLRTATGLSVDVEVTGRGL